MTRLLLAAVCLLLFCGCTNHLHIHYHAPAKTQDTESGLLDGLMEDLIDGQENEESNEGEEVAVKN